MERYSLHIGGQWVPSVGGEYYEAVNPHDNRPIGLVPKGDREDVRRAVAAARAAQLKLAAMSVWERSRLLLDMADAIDARADDLARILVTEQGHVLRTEAEPEAAEAAGMFRMYAEQIKWLETSCIPVQDPHKRVFSIRQPRGVYAVLTPFNFPIAIPSEYLPAAIATGNAVVWIPSPTTSICGIKLLEAMLEGGLPDGVVNLVTGPGAVVGDEAVSHPDVDAVALTGGSGTGRLVADRAAGKPLLLELGGNGPTVVLDDADLDWAAKQIADCSFLAAGQVCSATERVLAHRSVAEPLVEKLVAQAGTWVVGDPFCERTTLGPLNNPGVVEKMRAHLSDAVSRGAEIVCGGRQPEHLLPGNYYQPTVLTGFTRDSLLNREETFGPIAPVASFDDEDEAWETIRACRLGLVSAVFTRDLTRAWRWAEKLRTGIVVVNDFTNYWETHLPFGGASGTGSGLGRLGGRHTLEAMTDLKTIAIHVG